ncbi:MAG: DUF3365 domain-containing protein [Pseudomonadales bacterium]|nr:DUF3365 domain-containing protein [Pseudomonadales bacterium]
MKNIAYLILLIYSFNSAAATQKTVQDIAQQTTQIYVAAMKTIFENQSIINSIDADKSHLFGENFIAQVKAVYVTTFKKEFPKSDNIVTREMLLSMKVIMETNKALLLDKRIKVKGFIPAIFAFQLSQRFSNAYLPMRIKFSGFTGKLYNELNKPDKWEQAVLEKIASPSWGKGQTHFEIVADEVRYMYPLYHDKGCLSCHGAAADNILNQNLPPSKWTNINIAGFKMQNFKLNQLAGGVSFAMDKLIFEQYDSKPEVAMQQKLVMGVFDYPPYIKIENNGDIKQSWPQHFTESVEFIDLKLVGIPRKRLRGFLQNGAIQLAFPIYDIAELQPIGKPITFEIPGLCFKKENFIPFLSATHLWKNLRIGFPGGTKLVSVLKKYNKNPNSLEIVGSGLSSRLTEMLLKERFDAIYVQNINQIYSIGGKYYDTIACSGFYGNLQPVYVAGLKDNLE